MKIEILKKDEKEGKLAIAIRGTNSSFVNALRRTAIEEVPTLAIEDVEIRKNSSVLYDEMIGLRLGLIPLTTDLSSYNLPEECVCKGEGCAQCQLKLTLKAQGPGIVHASELVSSDPKVKPVYPEMPITKLLKGQKLEIEATAKLGTGRQHMKWAPGLVYYKHLPKIKVGSTDNAAEIVKRFDDEVKAQGNKLVVDESALLSSVRLDSSEELSEGAIKLEQNDTDFVFMIESWGQLTPEHILAKAADIFKDNLKELDKDIQASS